MAHQSTKSELTQLLDALPPDAMTAVGRIAAMSAYLETEFDLALECLLRHPKAEGLHDEPLLMPFTQRLGLIREVGKRVYPAAVYTKFDQVLDRVASAHGARNSIVHGRLRNNGDGRIVVELHRHVGKGGLFRVSARAVRPERLVAISDQIADTTARLIAFNRAHLPGRPASWLDIRRQPLQKPARTLPEYMQDRSSKKKPKRPRGDHIRS